MRPQHKTRSGKTRLVAVHNQTEGTMGKVRVAGFGVSIDGFGAGPDQSLENPLGKLGGELHRWFYPTRIFRSMIGEDGGTDDRFASAAAEGFGAFILGRNMFGPIRGDGRTTRGRAGGATIPRITRQPLFLPTTPARRLR
jgi:hypothetical protein